MTTQRIEREALRNRPGRAASGLSNASQSSHLGTARKSQIVFKLQRRVAICLVVVFHRERALIAELGPAAYEESRIQNTVFQLACGQRGLRITDSAVGTGMVRIKLATSHLKQRLDVKLVVGEK